MLLKALQVSAAESNLTIGAALKDRDGRPQPVKGVYWSLTHKPAYVGAIVARRRVGIDIETIVQRKTEALFDKVADGCPVPVVMAGGPKVETNREVLEFVDDVLGEEGLARSVVVVATSDHGSASRSNARSSCRSPRGYRKPSSSSPSTSGVAAGRFASISPCIRSRSARWAAPRTTGSHATSR